MRLPWSDAILVDELVASSSSVRKLDTETGAPLLLLLDWFPMVARKFDLVRSSATPEKTAASQEDSRGVILKLFLSHFELLFELYRFGF